MKISLISDLHLEGYKQTFPIIDNEEGSDVLLIAGDLYSPGKGIYTKIFLPFMDMVSDAYEKVFVIPGNHEFYDYTFEDGIIIMEDDYSHYPNVTFLNNSFEDYLGIRFIGSILWTNYWNSPVNEVFCSMQIADFKYILQKYFTNITVEDILTEHNKSVAYLQEMLAVKIPTVVMTHHGPTLQSIGKYTASPLDSAFATNDCNHLFGDHIKLWVHGHTHKPYDYMVGKTRVMCNPAGYRHEMRMNYEPVTFDV